MADETEAPDEEVVDMSVKEFGRQLNKIKKAINSRVDSLQSQLSILKNNTESEIEDINNRIDRIRSYLETTVGLITSLDDAIDKVMTEVDRLDKHCETNSESIQINRKNLQAVLKYAKGVSMNLNKAWKEVEDLKDSSDDFKKFKWQFTIGLSTVTAVLGWLFANNNLQNLWSWIKSFFAAS